jgi:hypothetical protein
VLTMGLLGESGGSTLGAAVIGTRAVR